MKTPSRRLTSIVLLIALAAIAAPRMAQAASLTATFTYPTDGATTVNMSTPIQWTTIAGAQAYYLYLGSTLGANNLANSGELQQTSYVALNVPTGVLVYARLWTKVSDVWRFVDITFTATAANVLDFTYPAPGAVSADMSQPFQWNTITDAQTYYLYIGTAVGLKDLLDTGEFPTTSYLAYNLPINQVLYLRLWVKVSERWRYTDRTIIATNTATQLAQFIYPTNGATNVNVAQPITWSTALNADKYYLYVGTTAGAKNLVDSGELTGTSYLAATLPGGQTLYATLWTRVAGTWRSTAITFTATASVTPVASNFIYPTNGSTMDISRPFTWTSVPNVQAYYLYVGTAVGTHNIVNSGETLATSFSAPNLPTTGTFYGRIYAKVAGVWRSSDIVFSTSPLRATLITPANGSTGFIASTTPFTWTSVPIADKYYLYVGTSVGAKDLIDSQELCDQVTCLGGPLGTAWNGLDGGNSIGLGQLVTGQTLYARLWTMVGGVWRYVDSTFATAGAVTILDPLDGSTKEAVHQKYLWTLVPGATAYRVTVQLLCDDTHFCTEDQKTALLEDSGLLDPTTNKQDLKNGTMSYTAAKEPPYTKLVVKVYVQVGGVWYVAQATYTHKRVL
jgi:hypothetical protein